MDWPSEVPYFTIDDVHNIDGEYDIIEDGLTKRCAMGWLKHLFLDFDQFGPLDMFIFKKAEVKLRAIGKISKWDSVEEWNDQQSRKHIMEVLNRTMKELGYEVND